MKKLSGRRAFLQKTGYSTIAAASIPAVFTQSTIFGALPSHTFAEISDRFPSQDIESVREIVGASHARFDRVKEMVTARPQLAKATYDWGFGDWESALGAASHMGRKDIAELLMEYGTRPNIFTYAMLGKVDAIKSMVEATPGVQRINGPHGITLQAHAKNRLRWDNIPDEDRKGGQAVVDYLESLGDANQRDTSLDISKAEKKMFLGTYEFGSGERDYFEVALNRGGNLAIKRGKQPFGRVLNRVEEFAFAPGGAPSVRVRFDIEGGRAAALSVHDPEPLVKAVWKES